MNNDIIFSGPFKEILPKYIEYKKALGYSYAYDYAKRYREMDDFFKLHYSLKSIELTKNMAIHFIQRRGTESNMTICHRCSIIREFAYFLKISGYENIYILQSEYIPKISSKFIPYIFTTSQISSLFKVIDNYNFKCDYFKTFPIFSTLSRILYGCGLRLGEALRLKISDINLSENIIQVKQAKNNTSRIVGVSRSLSVYLEKYIEKLNFKEDSLLFLLQNNKPITQDSVRKYFKKFYSIANIQNFSGKNPRIHDLRHTYAVHTLQNMIKQNVDIYCCLPYLASVMGHKNITTTEKYLRLIEDDFFNVKLENIDNIFKEVNIDE